MRKRALWEAKLTSWLIILRQNKGSLMGSRWKTLNKIKNKKIKIKNIYISNILNLSKEKERNVYGKLSYETYFKEIDSLSPTPRPLEHIEFDN